jgi:hypothetical protein
MTFERNHPKYGGRQAGTSNKLRLLALLDERWPGFNPITAMGEMYHDPATPPELKARLLSEIASYSSSHLDHIQNPTCLKKPLASFGERVCKA